MPMTTIQPAEAQKTYFQSQPRTTPATIGPSETADVDHHVEDAEAHRAGLLVGGLGHGADHHRLEHPVPDGDQEVDPEEAPEGPRRGEQDVGRRHHHRRGEEHPLEAVAVGQRAEDRREEVEEEGGDALDDAAVLGGEAEPARRRSEPVR